MDTLTTVVVLLAAGVIGAVHEVSVRRRLMRAAEALAEAQALLADRKDLASVGQLVSGLAHELKSPLQGVLGNTEVMLASPQRDVSTSEALQQIREDATRAAGIVRHLLAFTETTTLSRRWHDINVIVLRAVAASRDELESSGAHVEIVKTERLPLVYVDGRQLEKVIVTLLARPLPEYAVAGGRPAAPSVTIATRRGNDRLLIDIDDPSDGAEDASWSADIAACRRVLEAHGGSLEVESRGTSGFRFHMELPVAAEGVDSVSAPSPST
jgi:signal transduction histidine kinase